MSRRIPGRRVGAILVFWIAIALMAAIPVEPASATTLGDACGATCAAPQNEQGNDAITEPIIETAAGGLQAWVAESVGASVRWVMGKITETTTPVVNGDAQEGDWFAIQYQMMMNVAWWLMLPLLFVTILHSVLRGSMQLLIRSITMYLPLAVLGTIIATTLIQLLIEIVDDMCRVFLNLIADDLAIYMQGFDQWFLGDAVGFILGIVVGLVLILFTFYLWIVFVIRDASVYLAVMFMPVGFAMMVWPLAGRYFRKMVEFLVGIIVAKLVMVIIISLSIAALAGSTGAATAGISALYPDGSEVVDANDPDQGGIRTDQFGGPGPDGIIGTADDVTTDQAAAARQAESDATSGLAGTPAGDVTDNAGGGFFRAMGYIFPALVMLALAALSPPMTIKLVGNLGIGEMAGQVADSMNTQAWLYQYIGAERMTRIWISNPRKLYRQWRKGKEIDERNNTTSQQEQALAAVGVHRNADGTFQIPPDELDRSGLDERFRPWVEDGVDPARNNKDATGIAARHHAARMGADLQNVYETASGGYVLERKNGASMVIMPLNDPVTLLPVTYLNTAAIRETLRTEADRQVAQRGEVVAVDVITPAQVVLGSQGQYVGRNRQHHRWVTKSDQIVRRLNGEYGTDNRIHISRVPRVTVKDAVGKSVNSAEHFVAQRPRERRPDAVSPSQARRNAWNRNSSTPSPPSPGNGRTPAPVPTGPPAPLPTPRPPVI